MKYLLPLILLFFGLLQAQNDDMFLGDEFVEDEFEFVDNEFENAPSTDFNAGDEFVEDEFEFVDNEFEDAPSTDFNAGDDIYIDEFEGAPALADDMNAGDDMLFDEFEGALPKKLPSDLNEGDSITQNEFKKQVVKTPEIKTGDNMIDNAIEEEGLQEFVFEQITDPFGRIRSTYLPEETLPIFRGTVFHRTQYFFRKVDEDKRNFQHESTIRLEFTPEWGPFNFHFIPEFNIDDFGAANGSFVLTNLDDNGERRSVISYAEAYISTQIDFLDVSIGKKIYAFGAAFGPNPTDILNPFDLIDPLEGFNISNNRKIGVWSAIVNAYLPSLGPIEFPTITAIFVPRFTKNRIAFEGSRWFFDPFEGLDQVEKFPAHTFENSQWLTRFSATAKGYDFSISYYEGVSHFASQEINGAQVINFFDNIRVIGADFVTVINGFKIFGEMTHTWSKKRDNDDFFSIIFGGSYKYASLLYDNDETELVAQILFNRLVTRKSDNDNVVGFNDEAGDRALIFFLRYDFDTRLGLQGATQINFNEDYEWTSHFYELEIFYKVHNNLTVSAKAQFLNGENTDLFGIFKDNDSIFLTLDYTF